MSGLTYRFEDLPLARFGEIAAVPVSGYAEIEIDESGDWALLHLDLDGVRESGASVRVVVPYSMDRDSWWQRICVALHHDRIPDIERQVAAAFEASRGEAA